MICDIENSGFIIAHSNSSNRIHIGRIVFELSIMTSRRVRRKCRGVALSKLQNATRITQVGAVARTMIDITDCAFLFVAIADVAASYKRATDVSRMQNATARDSVRGTNLHGENAIFHDDTRFAYSLADFSARLVVSLTCGRRSARNKPDVQRTVYAFPSLSPLSSL